MEVLGRLYCGEDLLDTAKVELIDMDYNWLGFEPGESIMGAVEVRSSAVFFVFKSI